MNGIVLFRKDYQKLLAWKSKKNHFPIIIRGLRQVGKSYLAEYFANNEYGEEYVPVLDFRHNKSLSSIFNNVQNLSVENIIERMEKFSKKTGLTLGQRKRRESLTACFFLNEVEEFLKKSMEDEKREIENLKKPFENRNKHKHLSKEKSITFDKEASIRKSSQKNYSIQKPEENGIEKRTKKGFKILL